MDKLKAAALIIEQILPLAPFEGWHSETLAKAALAAGYQKTDAVRVFPGGAVEAAELFLRQSDAEMLEALKAYHLDTMKVRERIALAVRLKLCAQETHREAVRKAVTILALPFNSPRAIRRLYETVDAIWRAIGDTSTDFNFYTKRLLLGAVYSATLLYWLDDKSPDHENSWAFLDRRIENVMVIEKAKHQIKNWFDRKIA